MEKHQYLGSNICYGPKKKKKVSITIATFLHEIKSSESTYGKIQLEQLSLTQLQAENRIL